MKNLVLAMVTFFTMAGHATEIQITVFNDSSENEKGVAQKMFDSLSSKDLMKKFILINEQDKSEKTVVLKVGSQMACLHNPAPYSATEVKGHVCLMVTTDEGSVLNLASQPSLTGLIDVMGYRDGTRMSADDFWDLTGLAQ